ncbi:NUDIX hydrolase [Isobaculum melis]|uniref:ADP-ribose pyrophosphatase YjhB, NUDIX family n=1 Tax=Isobaculum melis TaxID=142588 RepID=A0A1H9PPQ2_9LACT|nr:NUDIX domain-containing protein [Isobaculum melis]SER50147.1 ADP-ribose pyrophosphatase YjhB, NUDIX family [Isobaculum melis]
MKQIDLTLQAGDFTFNHRVAGICLKNDCILLEKNFKGKHWSLPGGRILSGESSSDAIERELTEELGISVLHKDLFATAELFFTDTQLETARPFHEVSFYYTIDAFNETIPFVPNSYFNGYEHEDERFIWFPLANLNTLNFQPRQLKKMLAHPEQAPYHFISNTLLDKEQDA